MSNKLIGYLSFTASAIFFTVSAVLVKLIQDIPGLEIAFIRVAVGLIILGSIAILGRKKIGGRAFPHMIGRGVFNSLAVFLFYESILRSSLAEANVLNMLYPLFILMVAPFLLKERFSYFKLALILIGFAGVWLITNPSFGEMNVGHIYGIMSALVASIGIVFLRGARKHGADVFSIMFFLNFFGVITLLIIMKGSVTITLSTDIWIAVLSAFTAMLGQLFITFGYRFAEAADGGIMISSRIPFSVIAGMFFFGEILTTSKLIGMLLIFATLVLLAKKQDAKLA